MAMTAEAKRELSSTIRALRTRLLDDLHDATESAYRLSVHEREAGLSEAARVQAEAPGRLDQGAGAGRGRPRAARSDRRTRSAVSAEKQAAYTLLNRLIFLRLLEAAGPPLQPAVVTGGWESRGYKDFRELAPALVRGDETEGYAYLLAARLRGSRRRICPASTVRRESRISSRSRPRHSATSSRRSTIPMLASCWTDDMTLGWVYQYWNDPEREALDAKLNSGGKLAPHEIASKTQMFTERYMVDWLLQNSLGPMWLAMCRKHGWTPEVEADGTLAAARGERRVEWRAKRESGEVSLTELMPLHTDAERRWAYYLPQPIPDDAVEHAPETVRDLKIIDPAVGSGHFLVVLFDLLLALYQEEARHRGERGQERWSASAIVESILENNLHGIDLDPRAVQIAAAALWLKAKLACREAHPARLNLVASNLRLASLPDDDPALVELRREVEREDGHPSQSLPTPSSTRSRGRTISAACSRSTRRSMRRSGSMRRRTAALRIPCRADSSASRRRRSSGWRSTATRLGRACSIGSKDSSPGTRAAMTWGSGCAASSSRRVSGSCECSARGRTISSWATRPTRARPRCRTPATWRGITRGVRRTSTRRSWSDACSLCVRVERRRC